MNSDDALITARERITDADLSPGVSAKLLDDVAAAADYASDLTNGAEVAEDGVLGCYKRRVICGGVPALVLGAGVGIGVGMGALAVGTTLTGHRREWALYCAIAYGYVRLREIERRRGVVMRARVGDLFQTPFIFLCDRFFAAFNFFLYLFISYFYCSFSPHIKAKRNKIY